MFAMYLHAGMVLALVLAAGIAGAAEIRVPLDYATIQSALDAAEDGDRVMVATGIYKENLSVVSKSLVIQGGWNADFRGRDPAVYVTVLDPFAEDPSIRYVTCSGGECSGFTLRRTHYVRGTAIYMDASSPHILNNLIIDNPTDRDGAIGCFGGANPLIEWNTMTSIDGACVFCSSSSPVIRCNCMTDNWGFDAPIESVSSSVIIIGNTIVGNDKGISASAGSAVTILDNYISRNGNWGGIYVTDTTFLIIHNTISGNQSYLGYGGGIHASGSTGRIEHNDIAGNTALFGGGIYCGSDCLISDNLIKGNTAEDGGAIYCVGYSPVISGNEIVGNLGVEAIHLFGSSPLLEGNAICGSRHPTVSSGAYALFCDRCTPVMCNNILCNSSSWPYTVYLRGSSAISISYCDVQGGAAGVLMEQGCTLTWGPGNIDADPLFVMPGHWDDLGTETPWDDVLFAGDYHLLPGSPCIDAGTNDVDNPATTEIETLPEKDIAGVARVIDGNLDGTATVDMGAYEYLPGDVNHDGRVNILDLIVIRNVLGQNPASVPAARQADLNCDGNVNVLDLIFARNRLNTR